MWSMLQIYFLIYSHSAPASSAKSDQDWYAPSWTKVSMVTAWALWILYEFPAGKKSRLLVMFRVSLYRELGEQVGRWADRALTSSHRCWDFQNWWHPQWIITTEQHAHLLLFATVLWCFLQSGQWNWAGQLQLLASVSSGFSCTFVQWHREVHN